MANKKQTKQNNVINMSNFDLRETTSELGGYIDSNIDINLLFIVLFLVGFGLLMVYSASSYVALRDFGNSSYFFRKQIIADVLGIACMIVTLFIPLKKIERFKYPMLGMAYAVIFLVLPFGIESHGARRWIQVPFVGQRLQPAEITKLLMILFLAAMINSMGNKIISSWKGFLLCMGFASVASLLLYTLTNNLSSALIVFCIAFVMCFVASADYKKYILLTAAGLAAAGGLVAYVASREGSSEGSFRLTRISSWLRPENSTETSAHQMLQGLYAIGNGGVFGRGLGQSIQKMSNLPEPHNDMIFSVICEELGIVGAITVIIMFILLISRMYLIARDTQDTFSYMLVVGVMAHVMVQVVMHIAVATNSMPNTGVSLPFVSYGGSSVAFLMAEMGIVFAVNRNNRAEVRK